MPITDEELFKKAKWEFGFAKNEICEEAGWILPDGSLLNFDKGTMLPKEHQEVRYLFSNDDRPRGEFFDPNTEFMKRGAIRVKFYPEKKNSKGGAYIEVWDGQKITEAQRKKLLDCTCNINGNSITIDNSYKDSRGLFWTNTESETGDNCEIVKKALRKPLKRRPEHQKIEE